MDVDRTVRRSLGTGGFLIFKLFKARYRHNNLNCSLGAGLFARWEGQDDRGS
jgi:hypothetical protein